MSANIVVSALQRSGVASATEDEFDPMDDRLLFTPTMGAMATMSSTRTDGDATMDDRVGSTSADDATTIEFETSDDECALTPIESAPRGDIDDEADDNDDADTDGPT